MELTLRFAHGINGTTYGPGRIRVPENIARTLQEQETRAAEVEVVVFAGVGGINESDIMLASASKTVVIGFNVRPSAAAKALAEQEQVDVRFYDIIYNLLNEVQAAMEGMLEPLVEERVIGKAEVRAVFSVSKVGTWPAA